MRLMFLPPYSPELNPAGHLREAIREDCFANHVFTDLDAVEATLSDGIASLEADPSRTQSTTGFRWITSISLNAPSHERVKKSTARPESASAALDVPPLCTPAFLGAFSRRSPRFLHKL